MDMESIKKKDNFNMKEISKMINFMAKENSGILVKIYNTLEILS